MTGFERQLERGLVAESLIAKWLLRRGWTVLPAYEKEHGEFKGPRIYAASGLLISPDMLAFRFGPDRGEVHWIEAKSKAAFTWHRISQTYQDGIDKRHWLDYVRLSKLAPWPVWLLFLHAPGHVAKDNPPDRIPPTGLYGGRISHLRECIDHDSDRWGNSGMVYWCVADLCFNGHALATWKEVAG